VDPSDDPSSTITNSQGSPVESITSHTRIYKTWILSISLYIGAIMVYVGLDIIVSLPFLDNPGISLEEALSTLSELV